MMSRRMNSRPGLSLLKFSAKLFRYDICIIVLTLMYFANTRLRISFDTNFMQREKQESQAEVPRKNLSEDDGDSSDDSSVEEIPRMVTYRTPFITQACLYFVSVISFS